MANDLGYAAPANAQYKDPTTVNLIQGIHDNITALANLLVLYKQDVKVNVASDSSLTVSTGSIVINKKLRKNTANITLGWSMTGGNTIAETSSTGYYIWAYASGASSTFECAINNTSASMTGNANSRLIGWFWNDTGNNVEGAWYFDNHNTKTYESKWLNVSKATSYVCYHNLNTKSLGINAIYSLASDGTSCWADFSDGGGDAGLTIAHVNDTQYHILTHTDALGSVATGGGDLKYTSGYAKITMKTQ